MYNNSIFNPPDKLSELRREKEEYQKKLELYYKENNLNEELIKGTKKWEERILNGNHEVGSQDWIDQIKIKNKKT